MASYALHVLHVLVSKVTTAPHKLLMYKALFLPWRFKATEVLLYRLHYCYMKYGENC